MIVAGTWLWVGSPGPRSRLDGPRDLGAAVLLVFLDGILHLVRCHIRWHYAGADGCYHTVVVGFAACPFAYGSSWWESLRRL